MAGCLGKKFNFLLFCAIFTIRTSYTESKLSDYVTICSARDPKLNDCFMKSAMKILHNMTNGIQELGLPKIDPLQISNTYLQQKDIGVILSMSEPAIYDLSKAVITNASVDPEEFKFDLNLYMNKQLILGNYKVKGKIFIMPIHGNGRINVTLNEVNVTIRCSGAPEIRDGALHMKLTDISVLFVPKSANLHLDNLFNGNEMLGSIMHDVLNKSWEEMFNYLKPDLEKLSENEISKILNDFLSRMPYHELFHDLNV